MAMKDFDIQREQGLFTARHGKLASRGTGVLLDRARFIAIQKRSGNIGTEHLLWGLAETELARPMLEALHFDPGRLATSAELFMYKGGPGDIASDVDYTPRSNLVLGLATRQADLMGDWLVDIHHVLIGMVVEGNGIAGGVLESQGVNFGTLRPIIQAGMAVSRI